MTAHSDQFPWPSYYGHFNTIENALKTHSKFAKLEPLKEKGTYLLTLRDRTKIKIFVCECYAFGKAELHESMMKIKDLNMIIISSIWCSYSSYAKEIARNQQVGLFSLKEAMGAINNIDYWNYRTKEELEEIKRRKLRENED
ncbi:MAG: hypothetical protein A2426_12695 [Candidatus Lambdaproteobacteria bacterium RIFOXYC1_FULL_56_13]|nr:MAG: hypothetical protein A2426_12695 [Candidatus Lambdaproteobacteria bacterium RIFOXYC1_FULL_56_13]